VSPSSSVHTTNPYVPDADEVTLAQRGRAWAVHVFTTLGIVAAMLALRDVLTDHASYAIVWLLITLLIDGIDGPIARALEVQKRVPRIDGFVLDLIIDYVTCVIVPATFMYEFEVVPQNNYGIAVLCVLVFTSAIWFARRDMMSDDNWFRGFPAAWNLIAPVMFLLHARTGVGMVTTLVLSVAALTSLPFPHIMRARWLRPLTLTVAILYLAAILVGTVVYPRHLHPVRIALYVGSAYFIALSVARMIHDARRRRA
jgi:phosphatidylcholine synthase